MINRHYSIFTRISILLFSVIAIISILFTVLIYLSIVKYHEASTQLLNKDVAAHIAKFTSPFTNKGIDAQKADSVFYNAMVLSPSVEVYFLDTAGNVIAYHPNEKKLKQSKIDLGNVKSLIAGGGTTYLKGPDPREPATPKIFSASEVRYESRMLGYIYVILGSNDSFGKLLSSNFFNGLALKIVLCVIVLSMIFAFFYINRLSRRYNLVLSTLKRFQEGDLTARFATGRNDEMEPVTRAFNTLADLLVVNIDKLTKSGKERKDFIANISHDLRTPLSVARGYTETLLMGTTAELTAGKKEEYLQLLYKKIRQVEDMVFQLFDLSKMESVAFTPRKEPFIFSEVLQEIIHDAEAAAKEKNITIDARGVEDISWVMGDIGLMERLVQNLLVNALKYTARDGHIHISLSPANPAITFVIANTGQLLPGNIVSWFNDVEDDIFMNRPTNMGLGLVIVKIILRIHGFKYRLTCADGINKFEVQIPVEHTAR